MITLDPQELSIWFIVSIILFLLIIIGWVGIIIVETSKKKNRLKQEKNRLKEEKWKSDGYILGEKKDRIKVEIVDSHDDMIKIQYFLGYLWNSIWIKKSEFFKNRTLDELNNAVYKLEKK